MPTSPCATGTAGPCGSITRVVVTCIGPRYSGYPSRIAQVPRIVLLVGVLRAVLAAVPPAFANERATILGVWAPIG
jgi:hypothetical protein